jgi:hypothetical protein
MKIIYEKRLGHDLVLHLEIGDIPVKHPFLIQTEPIWLGLYDITNLIKRTAFRMGNWKCYAFPWHTRAVSIQSVYLSSTLSCLLNKLDEL